jgi:flagella basal body P-ring formation protein FlgA
MKLCAALVIAGIACAASAEQRACREVEGERIFARDLAVAIPAFGALVPQLPVAFAPAPGSQRIMHAAELVSLARRYSIELTTVEDLCFEWPMQPLEKAAAMEAMRASLRALETDTSEATIEIVEMSRNPVPRGRIEFPRDRLGTPAAGGPRAPVLWRGNVVYGGDRRFAIWARVTVAARFVQVVAIESLRTGQPVEPRQLRLETSEGFPLRAKIAGSIEQVAGRLPLRPFPAGSPIHLDQLAAPFDVNRGDLVDVEVRSGATRLAFSGTAETAGRNGDVVAIRNEGTNRLFQARVNGKGKALVLARAPLVK